MNIKPTMEEVITVLRETTEVLEVLRRCHGTDVSAACYPALNNARDVIARIDYDTINEVKK